MAENPKEAAQTRKPPLDLLEYDADVEIARALHTGVVKYGRRNYITIPISAKTYGAAIRRHVGQWLNGEDLDPESGVSHLAHIGANVHVLLKAIHDGNLDDDRGPADKTMTQITLEALSNGISLSPSGHPQTPPKWDPYV